MTQHSDTAAAGETSRRLYVYNGGFLTNARVKRILSLSGYVLVIDQTDSDASVTASRADRNTFLEMLFVAREEFPAARILITPPKQFRATTQAITAIQTYATMSNF